MAESGTYDILYRRLDRCTEKWFQAIDLDLNTKAWRNTDDCLVYWYLTLFEETDPITADDILTALPRLREMYRLYRFRKYGYVKHEEGEMKDSIPVYYSTLSQGWE